MAAKVLIGAECEEAAVDGARWRVGSGAVTAVRSAVRLDPAEDCVAYDIVRRLAGVRPAAGETREVNEIEPVSAVKPPQIIP